jgi:hypothetical protein
MSNGPPIIEDYPQHNNNVANFDVWKAGVGLPLSFPNLAPIADEDLSFNRTFYAGPLHLKAIREIAGRAGGTLTRVWLSRGQGCTTLSRFIFRVLLKDAIQRRMIPVRLAFDDASQQLLLDRPLDFIQDAMRRDIIWSLSHERWDYVLGATDYARIIGAKDTDPSTWNDLRFKLHAVLQTRDEKQKLLASQPAAVSNYPDQHESPVPEERLDQTEEGSFDLVELARVSPNLAKPVDDLLATLSNTFRVRVCLQVDLSSALAHSPNPDDRKHYGALVAALQRGIKALHQRDQHKDPPTYPTVLNEMYFGHRAAFQILEYGWLRTWQDVEYPWYRQIDFMAILSRYHYPQPSSVSGQNRQEALAAVMDQGLLDTCVGEDIAISETIARLTQRCHEALPDSEKIPYQLRASTTEGQ